MGSLGVPELLVIFAIIFLLFGARKLPDLASGLGGAIHNFKKAMRQGQDDDLREAEAKRLAAANTPAGAPTAVPTASEPVPKP
jgi:sec-independent protein translocase protein TatA